MRWWEEYRGWILPACVLLQCEQARETCDLLLFASFREANGLVCVEFALLRRGPPFVGFFCYPPSERLSHDNVFRRYWSHRISISIIMIRSEGGRLLQDFFFHLLTSISLLSVLPHVYISLMSDPIARVFDFDKLWSKKRFWYIFIRFSLATVVTRDTCSCYVLYRLLLIIRGRPERVRRDGMWELVGKMTESDIYIENQGCMKIYIAFFGLCAATALAHAALPHRNTSLWPQNRQKKPRQRENVYLHIFVWDLVDRKVKTSKNKIDLTMT